MSFTHIVFSWNCFKEEVTLIRVRLWKKQNTIVRVKGHLFCNLIETVWIHNFVLILFQITFKTSTQTQKTQYRDDRKADEHGQCWVFFVTEILSYLLIIRRRSRYVTLPLKQNFWVSTNRGPSDMAGKKNEWLYSGTM